MAFTRSDEVDWQGPAWEGAPLPPPTVELPGFDDEIEPEEVLRPDEEDETGFLRPRDRTNFILIGLDGQQLADAIMVGTFYRDSGNINLMSVPRDMYTLIPDHRLIDMQANGLRFPRELKINAVRSIGGTAFGIHYLKEQLGEMLGVNFHFYVEVNLSSFRRIVEAIGGVEMNIPHRLFYEDPYHVPPLVIDIPAGPNVHLDGAMAEGLVRFRSFPTGDIERNRMQMEFMSQLFRQALTREAIMNDPMELVRFILEDVRTNIGILEAAGFLRFIGNVSPESVSAFTLPGDGVYINGISWFLPDSRKLPSVINQVFYADLIE